MATKRAAKPRIDAREVPMTGRAKDDSIISFAEAGRLIGKPRQTIARWAHDGLIPLVRHPSGVPGIWRSDFDAFYGRAMEIYAARVDTYDTQTV